MNTSRNLALARYARLTVILLAVMPAFYKPALTALQKDDIHATASTAALASAVSAHRAISAGRLSIIPLNKFRACS